MAGDVDAVLQVQLAVLGLDLRGDDDAGLHPVGEGGDDTGTGDADGLAVHGPLLDDVPGERVDDVPGLGLHGVVQDVAPPSLVGDLDLAEGAGRGQHPPLDLLSLQGGSGRGGSSVDLAVLDQRHLGVGTVVDDDAGLLLVEDVRHHHHGDGVGPDLVGDRRGYEHLGVGQPEPEGRGVDDVPVPGRGGDAEGLQHVLAGVGQVPDLDVLEQGQLEGVAADSEDLHLAQVDVHLVEQVVGSLDDEAVGHVLPRLHGVVDVVDDVHSGDGVPLGDRGPHGLLGVQVQGLAAESASSYVQSYAVSHSLTSFVSCRVIVSSGSIRRC